MPGRGTTLTEGGSRLALALQTGQMGFAIGEENVPVSSHLVIARKQKILGEGVVDQIVNHQGQARLVVAPRHLKEGAVVVHLGSTARPAGDGRDSRVVP